jgi:hypothetical protein
VTDSHSDQFVAASGSRPTTNQIRSAELMLCVDTLIATKRMTGPGG